MIDTAALLTKTGKLSSEKLKQLSLEEKTLLLNSTGAQSLSEAVYLTHYRTVKAQCEQCGALTAFKSFSAGYRRFCSAKCSATATSTKAAREQTCLAEYGTQFASSSKQVREKVARTLQDRFGVAHHLQREDILQKRTDTNIQRYGGASPRASAAVRRKTAETNVRRFGVESAFSSAAVREKIKATNLEKYGVDNPGKSPEIQKKIQATLLEKHGVSHWFQTANAHQNPGLLLLRDKNRLVDLYPLRSITEIAAELRVSESTVYNYLNHHNLQEKFRSSFEQEIVTFLESLGVSNIVQNSRKVIPPKELDIFLPDHNLAIEFNGVYWHHDGRLPDPLYHYNKFKACEEKGILLLSIFSFEWESKKAIWKEKIKHKLGLANTATVYARKTRIVALASKELRAFLNTNHIQGFAASLIRYGLEYQGKIVAVMTFSGKRAGIGSKQRKEGWYELVRYATSCPVVGGASKLLKHFIKTHSPSAITSYSDSNYSTGGMYQKLGFKQTNETKSSYSYYDPNTGKIYNRFSMTKFKLVEQGHDPNKTEREITAGLGYLRVWDCGTRTWELTC